MALKAWRRVQLYQSQSSTRIGWKEMNQYIYQIVLENAIGDGITTTNTWRTKNLLANWGMSFLIWSLSDLETTDKEWNSTSHSHVWLLSSVADLDTFCLNCWMALFIVAHQMGIVFDNASGNFLPLCVESTIIQLSNQEIQFVGFPTFLSWKKLDNMRTYPPFSIITPKRCALSRRRLKLHFPMCPSVDLK